MNFFQKIGENYVKKYKYDLLKLMTDFEDVAAWLIVWAVPVGTLVLLLKGGRAFDFSEEVFGPVFASGTRIRF